MHEDLMCNTTHIILAIVTYVLPNLIRMPPNLRCQLLGINVAHESCMHASAKYWIASYAALLCVRAHTCVHTCVTMENEFETCEGPKLDPDRRPRGRGAACSTCMGGSLKKSS